MISASIRLLGAALCGAALVACGGAAGGPAPAPGPARPAAPEAGDDGAFLVLLGNDTLAGEQFTRRGGTLTGEGVVRSPATLLRSYRVSLRADGTVSRFELTARRAAETLPPQRVTMTFGSASVGVRTQVGDSVPRTTDVAAPGIAVPYVGNSYGLLELATRAARRAPTDSTPISFVAAIGRVIPGTVRRLGADSMLVSLAGDVPFRVKVDADGRILGLQGTPTQRVAVTRRPTLDVAALSAERPIGTLSPLDTARGRVGRADVAIVYSRPARRGRTILGSVVPYDSVWRTGANAATVLTTSAALTIGGTRVPRGEYTLWTLPTRAGWKLIVNRQSGQWGTEYDASRDLARVDMTVARAPARREQFTITLAPAGAGSARLELAWDDFVASVPVVGRPR